MPGAIDQVPSEGRRRLRALGALGLAIPAVAFAASWASARVERAEAHGRAVATVEQAGGSIEYDDQAAAGSMDPDEGPGASLTGPNPLRDLFGPEYFREVRGVAFAQPVAIEPVAALSSFEHLATLQGRLLPGAEEALGRLRRFGSPRSITLGGPGVTDPALANLARSTRLRQVALHGAAITDGGIQVLAGLVELRALDLTGSPGLTDAGLAPLIEALPPLRWLRLDDTSAGDASVAPLARRADLEHLTLRGTKITDAATASFQDCLGMIQLDLGRTGVTDAGLARLRGMSRLSLLNLERTGVTDLGLADLAGLVALGRLDLTGTAITDAGLAQLRRLDNLWHLTITETRVTPEGIARLREAMPGRHLRIFHESIPVFGPREGRKGDPPRKRTVEPPNRRISRVRDPGVGRSRVPDPFPPSTPFLGSSSGNTIMGGRRADRAMEGEFQER